MLIVEPERILPTVIGKSTYEKSVHMFLIEFSILCVHFRSFHLVNFTIAGNSIFHQCISALGVPNPTFFYQSDGSL